MAYESLVDDIGREYDRHGIVLKSEAISIADKNKFEAIRDREAKPIDYAKSLLFLSQCLQKYYGKNAIILIDEYDVPLENAYFNGFYEQMLDFIRSLFESGLKTNPFLEFSVITGCQQISRESIFTGLNNLKIISITNNAYSEHFGFTEKEVKEMLAFYQNEDAMAIVKEWYDGYLFGNNEVYNPWSVLNFVDAVILNDEKYPKPFWSNTSSNNIVRELIEEADLETKKEIENLIAGGTIEKMIHEEITYSGIHETQDNLWNFLFFTGYLKAVSQRFDSRKTYVQLAIPNEEVKYIYENTITLWFDKQLKGVDFKPLGQAIEQGDCQAFINFVSEQLVQTISFFDYAENYYHGFLAGLLKGIKNYRTESNRESGTGRPDLIMRENKFRGKSAIIEIKVAKQFVEMEEKCQEALRQIADQKYDQILLEDGYEPPKKYGICFFKKGCLVQMEK